MTNVDTGQCSLLLVINAILNPDTPKKLIMRDNASLLQCFKSSQFYLHLGIRVITTCLFLFLFFLSTLLLVVRVLSTMTMISLQSN